MYFTVKIENSIPRSLGFLIVLDSILCFRNYNSSTLFLSFILFEFAESFLQPSTSLLLLERLYSFISKSVKWSWLDSVFCIVKRLPLL